MNLEIRFKQKPTGKVLELVKRLVPEKPLNEALNDGKSTEKSAPILGITYENLRLIAGGLLHTLRTPADSKEIIKICKSLCETAEISSLYYLCEVYTEDGTVHQYRVLFENPEEGVYSDLFVKKKLFENFKRIECEEKAIIDGKPFYVFYIKTGPFIKYNKSRFKENTCSLSSGSEVHEVRFNTLNYDDTTHGIDYGHPGSPLSFKIIRPKMEEAINDFKKEFERRGFKLTCEKIEIPG